MEEFCLTFYLHFYSSNGAALWNFSAVFFGKKGKGILSFDGYPSNNE